MRYSRIMAAGLGVALAGAGLAAADIPLTVREPGAAARTPARVTTGIPFARGELADAGTLSVTANGRKIPAQFRAHVPWEDGSVRWALMDTQVPVEQGGTAELTVAADGANPAPDSPVNVRKDGERAVVSTGPLEFALSKSSASLFEYIRLNGGERVDGSGRGAVLTTEDGEEVAAGPPEELEIEESGPIRAVVRVRGVFPDVHDGLLRYTARITAWAGEPQVHVHYWLENHGSRGRPALVDGADSEPPLTVSEPEWFAFRALAVELGLGLGAPVMAACEGAEAEDALRVWQTCLRVTDEERNPGGPYYTWDDFRYTITSGDNELATGARTDGAVELKGPNGRLVVAIREFWQNYDKAIALADGQLRLQLWTEEGQWPLPGVGRIRYNEMDEAVRPEDGMFHLDGGVHKGHEFVLDFSEERAPEAVVAELNQPLFALADPARYAETGAGPGMFAPPGNHARAHPEIRFKFGSWQRMLNNMTDPDSETSLHAARRIPPSRRGRRGERTPSVLWYGWQEFGAISVPTFGQVGVDYWDGLALLNGILQGDLNALRMGSEMVRHLVDIDAFWSVRDAAPYRGRYAGDGFRLSGWQARRYFGVNRRGLPAAGSRLEGVALYYMLTGRPRAQKAARHIGETIVDAWEVFEKRQHPGRWRRSWLRGNYPYPVLAYQRRAHTGRQGGAIAALNNLYELTGERRWLDEALGIFERNIVPTWEEHGPQLGTTVDRGYALVMRDLADLHRLTSNEQVLQLLADAAAEEDLSTNFSQGPMHLSGLYAYVGLVTGNQEYLERAAMMFARNFPEERLPAVFVPDTVNWNDAAANRMRPGHLVQYAWWRHGR